jgi:hypothetical protein
VIQDYKEHKETLDFKEHKVLKEHKETLDFKEHKVLKEHKEQ